MVFHTTRLAALAALSLLVSPALAATASFSQIGSSPTWARGSYPALSFTLNGSSMTPTWQSSATPRGADVALESIVVYEGGYAAARNEVLHLVLRETSPSGAVVARSSNGIVLTAPGAVKGMPYTYTFAPGTVLSANTTYVVTFARADGSAPSAIPRTEVNQAADTAQSRLMTMTGARLSPGYSPRLKVNASPLPYTRQPAGLFRQVGASPSWAKGSFGAFSFTLNHPTMVPTWRNPAAPLGNTVALDTLTVFDGAAVSARTDMLFLVLREGNINGPVVARSVSGLMLSTTVRGARHTYSFLPGTLLRRDTTYVATFVKANGSAPEQAPRFEVNTNTLGDSNNSRLLQANGSVVTPGYTPRLEISASVPPALASTQAPDYYYVLALAGQSNMVGSGEALPDPLGADAPDPRIVQIGRGRGQNLKLIPATHALDHVYDSTGSSKDRTGSHPEVRAGRYPWPLYGGTVGAGLNLAKNLLPYLPDNAGILLVPSARSSGSLTNGSDNPYTSGVTTAYVDGSDLDGGQSNGIWKRWGITGGAAGNESSKTGLYLDLRDRIRWALQQNPRNVLTGVVWIQGESDLYSPAAHKANFEAQVKKLAEELNVTHRAQCLLGDCANTPWVAGDTSVYWKQGSYSTVYGQTYGKSPLRQVSFVPFMYQADGVTPTEGNAAPYYNAQTNPTGPDHRASSGDYIHFGSNALRGPIATLLANGVRRAANKAVLGVAP